MAKEHSRFSIDRRRLLVSAAAAVTATGVAPHVSDITAVAAEGAAQTTTAAPGALAMNFSAATVGRLAEIARRNKLRQRAEMPLLSVARELRLMKKAEDDRKYSEAFSQFESAYGQEVWNQVLKPRREAEGNPSWWPRCWSEGAGYRSEVYRILRERFRAEQRHRSGRSG